MFANPAHVPQPLWVHMCADHFDVQGLVSLVWYVTSNPYTLSASFSKGSELWGEGFDWDILFRDGCSMVSHSLPIVWLWVSVLVHFFWLRKLFWWWLTKVLITEYNRMSLGVMLLLCSFSRTLVFLILFYFIFCSRSLGFLVSGSWIFKNLVTQVYGFHLMKWALIQIRYWLAAPTLQ